MADPIAEPSAQPPAARDAQREALRELVALVAHAAGRERQIQQQLEAQQAQADRALKQKQQQVTAQSDEARAHADAKWASRQAEMLAQHERQLADLAQHEAGLRDKIESDFEAAESRLKSERDHATWVADSVLEGVQTDTDARQRKLNDEQQARLDAIAAIRQQADPLLRQYGHRPTSAGSAKVDAGGDDPQAFTARIDAAQRALAGLRELELPRYLGGWRAAGLAAVVISTLLLVSQLLPMSNRLHALGVGLATGLLVVGVTWWLLRAMAKRQVAALAAPLLAALDDAHAIAERSVQSASAELDRHALNARMRHEHEVKTARNRFAPLLDRNQATRARNLAALQDNVQSRRNRLTAQHDSALAQSQQEHDAAQRAADEQRDATLLAAKQEHQQQLEQAQQEHSQARADLLSDWQAQLQAIQQPITGEGDGRGAAPWSDDAWRSFEPPRRFCPAIRFGSLSIDLQRVLQEVQPDHHSELPLPQRFALPALMTFPRMGSVRIQHDRAGRPAALAALSMFMTRLLTSIPPGRARLTIIDPVGLGENFSGFMHLADHDEALVGGRIWTQPEHITQRLTDLAEHMETIIQKYLRNEFATIDDYNAQAGELAEPYRFLVIADFPHGFEGEALTRLASIAGSGARCGVFTLIAQDTSVPAPPLPALAELNQRGIQLIRRGDHFVWNDEVYRQFPLAIDPPPQQDPLTELMHRVGRRALDAKRVEVPFGTIAPDAASLWSLRADDELRVPIGRVGATRQQQLRLGRGVAQHALVAGKTGSGKSTLLHALITNAGLWYPPSEVEFYLIDFKKGVEFKSYATHRLPHARAIAVESDREFGLSVLQRIDAELTTRGERFRAAGVQTLAAFRQTTGQVMPRTLLIIDEFQEFFSEDDRLAQEAAQLLDRLVRQGRAFGIHVLLGSQTVGGSSGLPRTTLGQIAVRIALQTSEADAQLILGDGNSAARLLSRPGESIYNDQGGLVEGNSPFQVAWLSDEQRDDQLARVRAHAQAAGVSVQDPIVFEGNQPAEVGKNRPLREALDAPQWPARSATPAAWLGEPVAIKGPTSVTFGRQPGANLLVVGQHESMALSVVASAMVSLAAQRSPADARFIVLDGAPADSPLSGMLGQVAAALPHEVALVEWRRIDATFAAISADLSDRQQSQDGTSRPAVYVVIFGLQRFRMLRRSEDSFSFARGGEDKPPAPDAVFAELLREGPSLGMHVLAWVDTPVNAERVLDRSLMREMDHRVLFQMSASDSSNLIDSPAANKLGMHRALAYSEERGVVEKFRPYAPPDAEWLGRVRRALAARPATGA
jgi:hypothetical protein